VLFGVLVTALVSLTFLPALTVMVLGWRRGLRQACPAPLHGA
jgi:predicted RND superfamily exporter protein